MIAHNYNDCAIPRRLEIAESVRRQYYGYGGRIGECGQVLMRRPRRDRSFADEKYITGWLDKPVIKGFLRSWAITGSGDGSPFFAFVGIN